MTFNTGFWTGGMVGTADRMNSCLLGWGLYSEFPAASADNKGALALATDKGMVYYSTDAAWTPTAIAPPASLAQGDIIFWNGTTWARLPPGTNGQVLKTQGAGANPVWGTVESGVPSAMSQPSRAIGTTYTNNTGKLLCVMAVIELYTNTGGNASFTPYSGSTSLGQHILAPGGGSSVRMSCTFYVLPDTTYRITSSTSGSGNTVTLVSWTEWTLG